MSKFVRPSLMVTDAGSPFVIVGISEVPVMSWYVGRLIVPVFAENGTVVVAGAG